MEFKDYVRIVLSHWAGVVVLALLGVAAAFGYSASQPPVYQATATGLVASTAPSDSTVAQIADQYARSRIASYVPLASTTEVAQRVIDDSTVKDADFPSTPAALIGHISVTHDPDTVLINIAARASTPEDAATLANAWARALAWKVDKLDGPKPVAADTGTTSGTTDQTPKLTDGLQMEVLTQAARGAKVLPRTTLNLVLGLAIGLVLGFGYALARHQFDRRLKSSEEVEKKFGVPVIGMIPQSSNMRQADGRELALAVTDSLSSTNASTAEGFRKLRTNLAYMDVDQPPRIIVVTSPKQSDGKSTVAANLAAAIAIGGQAVTLIDGDLRRPSVANSLAIVDGAGLTDVLVGRVTPGEVIQDHPDVPGLRVLASGAIPPNPSELLGSKAMQTLIGDLARDAMVIIDAPPLLPVTDAAVLTRSADGAIVVISHNGTLDTELAASLNHIATVHGRTLGIVFNRMRRSASSGFYGGDYYRYEYKPDTGHRKRKSSRSGAKKATKGARGASKDNGSSSGSSTAPAESR
jgi:capsular exopolysaccharide synthesis family protein